MYGLTTNKTVIVIVQRSYNSGKVDYIIGWDYNPEDGTWGQGHYGYKTFEEARIDADRIFKIEDWGTISLILKKGRY